MNRRAHRWLPAAGMVLLLLAGLFLWRWLGVTGVSAAPEEGATPASGTGDGVPALQTPEPTPAPPERTPPAAGPFQPDPRPDGYAVEVRAGLSYWGMNQVDASARVHRCRFRSGSGQLLPDYEWGGEVPETEAVAEDYFSDAVFIGNSLAQGFKLYAGLAYGDQYAVQSISVDNIGSEKVISEGGGSYITILDAMSRKEYGKVFVMLGINELSWLDKEEFYEHYARLIDTLRELQPEAELYLQSMTPVSERKSRYEPTFGISRIHEYNEVIRRLAADKEAHYLYIFDALADDTGYLPAGNSEDGVHPYGKYYSCWLDYLKTHTVQEIRR